MRNSVFSCLTAWLKSDNFEGKRRFLIEQHGLDFVSDLVIEASNDSYFNPRLRMNIYRLVYDLVLNDDGIFEDEPFYVREKLCQREDFLHALALQLSSSSV